MTTLFFIQTVNWFSRVQCSQALFCITIVMYKYIFDISIVCLYIYRLMDDIHSIGDKMAGKTTLALSVCFYGLYALFLSNSRSPFRNDLDEKAKFKYSGSQAFSDAENTESCCMFSVRLIKVANESWYIIHTMGVKLVLKQKYLRRRLAFTPASIATFNPIIYNLELTLHPLTENHSAHCSSRLAEIFKLLIHLQKLFMMDFKPGMP